MARRKRCSADRDDRALDPKQAADTQLLGERHVMAYVSPTFPAVRLPFRSVTERVDQVPHRLVERRDIILNRHMAHRIGLRGIDDTRKGPHLNRLPSEWPISTIRLMRHR